MKYQELAKYTSFFFLFSTLFNFLLRMGVDRTMILLSGRLLTHSIFLIQQVKWCSRLKNTTHLIWHFSILIIFIFNFFFFSFFFPFLFSFILFLSFIFLNLYVYVYHYFNLYLDLYLSLSFRLFCVNMYICIYSPSIWVHRFVWDAVRGEGGKLRGWGRGVEERRGLGVGVGGKGSFISIS